MKILSLVLVLGSILSLPVFSTFEIDPANFRSVGSSEVPLDICVPDVGPTCVCRFCVYNDDGTCSCPAEPM